MRIVIKILCPPLIQLEMKRMGAVMTRKMIILQKLHQILLIDNRITHNSHQESPVPYQSLK